MCEFNVKPNPDFMPGYKNIVVKERQNPVGIKANKNSNSRKKAKHNGIKFK